jgi:hypothetical protein
VGTCVPGSPLGAMGAWWCVMGAETTLALVYQERSAFGLQALQDIEPCKRPTCLLDQPTIAQIA